MAFSRYGEHVEEQVFFTHLCAPDRSCTCSWPKCARHLCAPPPGALIVVFPSQWHLVGPRLLEWLFDRLSDGLAATFHCERMGWPSCPRLFRFQQRDPSLLVLVTSGWLLGPRRLHSLPASISIVARCLPQLRFPEFGNKAGRPCSEPSGNTDGKCLHVCGHSTVEQASFEIAFVRCCSLLRPWTDSVNCRSSASGLLYTHICIYIYTHTYLIT